MQLEVDIHAAATRILLADDASPDIIVLDLELPGITGLEAAVETCFCEAV